MFQEVSAGYRKTMSKNNLYFEYLNGISLIGRMYRKWVLYARLSARLTGKCLDVGSGIGAFTSYRLNTIGVDTNPRCWNFVEHWG